MNITFQVNTVFRWFNSGFSVFSVGYFIALYGRDVDFIDCQWQVVYASYILAVALPLNLGFAYFFNSSDISDDEMSVLLYKASFRYSVYLCLTLVPIAFLLLISSVSLFLVIAILLGALLTTRLLMKVKKERGG